MINTLRRKLAESLGEPAPTRLMDDNGGEGQGRNDYHDCGRQQGGCLHIQGGHYLAAGGARPQPASQECLGEASGSSAPPPPPHPSPRACGLALAQASGAWSTATGVSVDRDIFPSTPLPPRSLTGRGRTSR